MSKKTKRVVQLTTLYPFIFFNTAYIVLLGTLVIFAISLKLTPFVSLSVYSFNAFSIDFLSCEGLPICLPYFFTRSLPSPVRSTIMSRSNCANEPKMLKSNV